MSWILTYTGKKIDFLDPQEDQIDIIDIAHALAAIPHFNGHTIVPISVAEHSILVARQVSEPAKRYALLHDASEAYTGDFPGPLKRLRDVSKAIKPIEDRLQSLILKAFGVHPTEEIKKEVKLCDLRMIATEQTNLKMNPPDLGNLIRPYNLTFPLWKPRSAEREFHSMFRDLFPELREEFVASMPTLT